MTNEQEIFTKIKPLIEGYTEGINWDFKESFSDKADIIKDIMAFSNSDFDGDSYIIFGVSESKRTNSEKLKKIKLNNADRKRLNTDAAYLYIPNKWELPGLLAAEISSLRSFSESFTQFMTKNMLISIPKCEFVPIMISKKRWLYVIIIKKSIGVFVSKSDIKRENGEKPIVKQGVLYIRVADTTMGADTNEANAIQCVRIWKKYIDWLENKQEHANEQN